MGRNSDQGLRPGWTYYFAYGSNLRKAQMEGRCAGEYECICASVLPAHRLAFVGAATARWGKGGVATVIPDPQANVPGVIYALSPKAETALDGFEGVAEGMYFKSRELLQYKGQPVLVYIAAAELLPENPPSAKYLATIREGYADWGIDLQALNHITMCLPVESWTSRG